MATDGEWWVRLNASKALSNMGPEGEKALLELLQGEDRYARDRAAATLEARGVTRRMVRQLAVPGRRGKRARTVVDTLIRSGVTRYLRGLLDVLPDSEERRILRQMLEMEDEPEHPASAEPPGVVLEKMGQDDDGSVRAEPAGAKPPDVEQIHVDPASIDGSLGMRPETVKPNRANAEDRGTNETRPEEH